MADERVTVEVDGHRLTLSNLAKILYPPADGSPGFSKAEVVDYYTRVAPVLLPHLAGRPATFTRWPDGVAGKMFFEKNAPSHTPEWVRRVRLPSPGSGMKRDTIDYVVVDDLATLVWAANLAALELHVPQWRVGTDGAPDDPDLLVLDLDPGPPATAVECCAVAVLLRERLAADRLDAYPKTSGSKGLQLYVPLEPTPAERTSGYARALAGELERAHPGLVVSRMAKDLRPGKVFVDWSQNNGAKTTVAPYSLRARPWPTVSTPLTWDEVAACRAAEDVRFVAAQVLERVAADGDLLAALSAGPQRAAGRLPDVPGEPVTAG
ncbi:MAG: non-homologous end-joining DNA ligase [Actinomycetes bacterium]